MWWRVLGIRGKRGNKLEVCMYCYYKSMEEDKENQVVRWEVLGYEGDEGMNLKDV